jgi:CheY-like chemotaxis protein
VQKQHPSIEMLLNPILASILPWINRRSGTDAYMTTCYSSQSNTLSSYLFNRNPILICFALSSDDFEKNGGAMASSNESSNNSHSPPVPSVNGNNRILIVDDDKDIATFFKLALDRAGFVTDIFHNPQSALTSFKKGAYDLLLLDINMPQMTGFELYKKISQIDGDVKVCFVTAFEEYYTEFKSEFPNLEEGKCYIKKPVGMDYLINAVKSRLDFN